MISAPGQATVEDVPEPVPGADDVVVKIDRVGVCGTDLELFRGDMAYLATGRSWYPLRPGHEWAGRVASIGERVDPTWRGARVMGDTMLGCGHCDRCLSGRKHLCPDLVEVGISLGFAGALAERIVVPAASLHRLPDTIDDTAAALVEPGGNAWRAADAAQPGPNTRILVLGAGTIGLLATAFAAAAGAEVHVAARSLARSVLAKGIGAAAFWQADPPSEFPFDAVIDATNDASSPMAALDRVRPGGRVVYIGLSGTPSLIETRRLVLKDVTAVGILSGSPGIGPAIEQYASGAVDPRPLAGPPLPLARASDVLGGWRPDGPAPKVHFDPRL